MAKSLAAARQFDLAGAVLAVRPLGAGNIHDTFLVTVAGRPAQAVLQRLNIEAFPHPETIAHNLRRVAEHLGRMPAGPRAGNDGRRWEVVVPIAARHNGDLWRDGSGGCWRMLSCVEDAAPLEKIVHAGQAEEIGFALGRFHSLIADLPVAELLDPLPDFHVTPRYLARYDAVSRAMSGGPPGSPANRPQDRACRAAIEKWRPLAPVLEEARRKGVLQPRPIHGDPKLDNILFDRSTQRAVALIDLDTVKPGLVLWDLGDCLRSCCNPGGEDPESLAAVRFDPELCRAVLRGYGAAAPAGLSRADHDHLLPAIRLIPFELGLRFFTDFLEGNRYFKVRDPEHSRRRALVQFRLLEEIEAQEDTLAGIAKDFRFSLPGDSLSFR